MRRMKRLFGASILLGCAAYAGASWAAVPPSTTHQGRLFDKNGAPVSEVLDVTFALYNSDSAGKPIWSEVHEVAFEDGYFSVALGSSVPLDTKVLDGSVRFMGITVAADPEMAPRAAIRSVPYALLANDVVGDIHPTSVSIADVGEVIDANGQWVGSPVGLAG